LPEKIEVESKLIIGKTRKTIEKTERKTTNTEEIS
jgi:hypothetical protein